MNTEIKNEMNSISKYLYNHLSDVLCEVLMGDNIIYAKNEIYTEMFDDYLYVNIGRTCEPIQYVIEMTNYAIDELEQAIGVPIKRKFKIDKGWLEDTLPENIRDDLEDLSEASCKGFKWEESDEFMTFENISVAVFRSTYSVKTEHGNLMTTDIDGAIAYLVVSIKKELYSLCDRLNKI